MGNDFDQAVKNALGCMFLRGKNKTHKDELDMIGERKTYLKTTIAANAGTMTRLAAANALIMRTVDKTETSVIDALMEAAFAVEGKTWQDLKSIANPKCNCDGKPPGTESCSGCDDCTCGDQRGGK